ncbi:hypothetical protein C482_13820 [Natrialba chahannaoensis JCM 10990]|uniref:Uncharacterized protein n=1 Tax=Natrialba chahannaoensis JCM 10990 TaxID=1227492 RepID=M0AG01_9EURY|nr:hypothetical protein [Natrialba chahannaoensis]ELY97316.1 hypothetical protein C482_13820 [Natrialba chahannaoensis JCM 10990]
MSDDRVQPDSAGENEPATGDSETDTGDSPPDGTSTDDPFQPSGGPQRVVSEESVDDILNSLGETTNAGIDISGGSDSDTPDDSEDSPSETSDESSSDSSSGVCHRKRHVRSSRVREVCPTQAQPCKT